ncbi:MAG TPA: DUF177 domain-containing protein [Stellaceae bacterium]|jgi:uncharacterized metal-binding protein YceD (DUF177 family)|nr:DUF177 domain-containing protein [Stellaceae bacterium]
MSEFSRLIDLSRLPPGETVHEIAAREEERAALARRFSLLALGRLEARVRLQRLAGGLMRLAAELSADVVQECAVTLDPVASRVEDSFSVLYGAAEEGAGEITLDGEAELVEPLAGTTLDIGEAVAQQLSLALDPFPRAPGAAASGVADAGAAADRPFAALQNWKEKG